MLYRKIESVIREHLTSGSDKIMIIEGARQVGKSYIIRKVGKELFPNYIELNFIEDAEGARLFENVGTVEDFYFQVSMIAGDKMGDKNDTLIFLDEIQHYPRLLTLLKFLREDDRYTFIASGSLLGITLNQTTSIPVGSIERVKMWPLDFEEFLIANGVGHNFVRGIRERFEKRESLDESTHDRMMDLFRKYLLVGGLPDAVKSFVETKNIVAIRQVQQNIRDLYAADAMKHERDSSRRLKIRRIYDLIPSFMENKKKRIRFNEIEDKKGKRFSSYIDEFDYLISAGIALCVNAVPTPVFPLSQAQGKNLLKLYMNDVGLLTSILYRNNIRAILDDEQGINLGAVYETVVAQELAAHGHDLYYYDNRSKGEVDYLIDDYSKLTAVPVEVKSGKNYLVHSALNRFLSNEEYHVSYGIVLSNSREIRNSDGILYMPIYDIMFIEADAAEEMIIE